jgi:tetratricopeptide (TPR) repeat protein
MKLNPSLARPHWIVGQAYQASEPADRESALKEFRELVRKEPRWVEGHASLAATLLHQGRVDEGLRSVREVLRRKPNYKWAQAELAKHLIKRNEYREAITVLRARPSLSPSYTVADAYLMLDELLARMDRPVEERREVWEQILSLDETIPAYRVARAEVSKRMAEVMISRPQNKSSPRGISHSGSSVGTFQYLKARKLIDFVRIAGILSCRSFCIPPGKPQGDARVKSPDEFPGH